MRATVAILGLLAASAASAAVFHPVLPPVEHLDTEVSTNLAISAASRGSRECSFSLEFSGTASNNVEIAFGADANGDGALSSDEVGLSAGWDCGEWFVANAATGERLSAEASDGVHRLVGKIRLRKDGGVREIAFCDGEEALFPALSASAAEWSFPGGWNTVRLVGRGENVRSGERFQVTATCYGFVLRLQ